MTTKRTKKARLDADKTAKPLTRIVGHVSDNKVIGPGLVTADSYETEEGERIPLTEDALTEDALTEREVGLLAWALRRRQT